MISPRRFFAEHARRPYVPGELDCCLAAADWCVHLGFPDPAEGIRGTYSSEEEYLAIVEDVGGVKAFAARMHDIGWLQADAISNGAVAAIGSPTRSHKQWAAVGCDNRWHVRWAEGWVPFTAGALTIWRPA
jgi:hypothetical protein